ncbi:hypothetical protein ARMGADRAFT_1031908 [Armillaria gallica]|uniref:Uncharacterized protein n=1 Tax=Armillaria gallica TaxID=47427 RepID=A0A2H3D7M6_ARMGA|nr:hypothetical protein ARMGADRAFT_1031908 [Armillaria gallica]
MLCRFGEASPKVLPHGVGDGEMRKCVGNQSKTQNSGIYFHMENILHMNRVMVAHEENMNNILNIIIAHPTELPLPGKPNPFTSFNREVVCTSESMCQGDSVEAKHGRESLRESKLMSEEGGSCSMQTSRPRGEKDGSHGAFVNMKQMVQEHNLDLL